MPEASTFSPGADMILYSLMPHGGKDGSTVFPSNLDLSDTRRSPGEPLSDWFIRVVNTYCNGDPKRIAIEDNTAVFGRIAWRERRLIYANIQCLVSNCELGDYVAGESGGDFYLRLDFDYETLSDPFSHPLPHIHVDGDLSPRFCLEGGTSANILVDFVEFVYRRYHPHIWLAWVEKVWNRHYESQGLDPDDNPLLRIVDAFANNQFEILKDYSPWISRIKRALRSRKDSMFGLHMDGSDREILEYPAAR